VKQSFVERHHFAAFVALVAAGIGLATVGVGSPGRVGRLQSLGLALTSPLARLGDGLGGLAADAWGGLASLGAVHEELAASRTEIRDLRLRLDGLREVEEENVRLRRLLRLEDGLRHRSVPARIIHRQSAPDRVLVIDRGADDGLRPDLAVVAPGGVVGKVLAVTASSAKVQCVNDPDAGVAVLVGDERRQAHAIVRDVVGGLLRLRHLELMATVAPGDRVVTSGLDQVHPKGWLVGTVEEVVEVPGFEPDVRVRPAVDFSRLEEVLVLVPEEPVLRPESRAASRGLGP
jgi:rod shape-determining protein MreC